MRLQRKKDVNEILADSKSLTQYLEDVYEVAKKSVFCLSGKAENGSNHQPVRAGKGYGKKMPISFTYWKYFADSGSTLLRRT